MTPTSETENREDLPSVPEAEDSSLRRFVRWLAARGAAGLNHWMGRRFDEAFGILTYHRVAWPVLGNPLPTCNVTPKQLRRQLTYLLDHGHEAWPLRRTLEFHRQGRPIPRTTFVVTFDDGYQNFYSQAWPVLRELNVPATLFVATAYLDSSERFPFDTWKAAGSDCVPPETWKPVTTTQCAAMLDHGLVDIGSHTHTHRVFRDHPDLFYDDLRTSREVLATRLGVQAATFSFPFGIHNPLLIDAARAAGVLCCLTTQRELVTPQRDPFDWGRFGVGQSDTGPMIAAKLDGWYSTARAVWQGVQWRRSSGQRDNSHSFTDSDHFRRADATD